MRRWLDISLVDSFDDMVLMLGAGEASRDDFVWSSDKNCPVTLSLSSLISFHLISMIWDYLHRPSLRPDQRSVVTVQSRGFHF